MNFERPDRTAVARLLREARLNWRLTRLGETLAALEPLIQMARDATDLTADPVPDPGGQTRSARQTWARGAVRLAAQAAYLLGEGERFDDLLDLASARWGEDPTLLQLAARQAIDQGTTEQAAEFARRAAMLAPRRPRILQLLARLEARLGRLEDALEAARTATRLRPRRAALRLELAHLALAAGRHDLGLAALGALIDPPHLLHARLLAGCGRWREAVEMYDRVIDEHAPLPASVSISPADSTSLSLCDGSRGVRHDRELLDAALERIDLLERLGDRDALTALADAELADPFRSPAVLVRLAEAMLNFGQARRCLALAWRCRRGAESAAAFAFMSVAANLLGRAMLAERCRRRLRLQDRALLARAWRRGMMAGIISDQTSCRRAGADPTQSILEPLLSRAVEVLSQAGEQTPGYADLHYHRANCLAALGRTDEAGAALDTALTINPNYADAARLVETLRAAA